MSFETTPSSTYANWELPVTEAEAGMWQMTMPEAEVVLKQTAPLADLDLHAKTLGKKMEAVESFTVDGHSLMWLKSARRRLSKAQVINGADLHETGTRLTCECDFSYRVGEGPFGKEVFRVFKAGCEARQKLLVAKRINISDHLGFDARNQFRPTFPFSKLNPKDHVEDAILGLVEAATKNNQWVGNHHGNSITVPVIQSILGMPRGGSDPENGPNRRAERWKYFHDLIADGRLQHDTAWQLSIPSKNRR